MKLQSRKESEVVRGARMGRVVDSDECGRYAEALAILAPPANRLQSKRDQSVDDLRDADESRFLVVVSFGEPRKPIDFASASVDAHSDLQVRDAQSPCDRQP